MSLDHFSFAAPSYLWVLLAIPLLGLYTAIVRHRNSRFTVAFTNLDVLAAAIAKRHTPWLWRLPQILLALALVFSGVALAQPRVQLTASDRSAMIVLLVDVSESMQAVDIPPTRLQAAVGAMHEFVGELPANDKVGLVTFSDKVEVIDDPTTDHTDVNSGLDTLSPQGGTALGAGVEGATKLIVSSLDADGVPYKRGSFRPAAIVLESDGAQDRGMISPFAAAQLAKMAGIRIYGVALGKPDATITIGSGYTALTIPVPPDPGTVGLLARDTGGQAFTATTSGSLFSTYHKLGLSIGTYPHLTGISSWFDVAAAVLLIAGLLIARLRGAALP
jgi:Ca-activated chloride channel family protein